MVPPPRAIYPNDPVRTLNGRPDPIFAVARSDCESRLQTIVQAGSPAAGLEPATSGCDRCSRQLSYADVPRYRIRIVVAKPPRRDIGPRQSGRHKPPFRLRPIAEIIRCCHSHEDDRSCSPETRSPTPAGLLPRKRHYTGLSLHTRCGLNHPLGRRRTDPVLVDSTICGSRASRWKLWDHPVQFYRHPHRSTLAKPTADYGCGGLDRSFRFPPCPGIREADLKRLGRIRPFTALLSSGALARQRSSVQLLSYSARSSNQQSAPFRFARTRASNS